jgi:hypothetical protein
LFYAAAASCHLFPFFLSLSLFLPANKLMLLYVGVTRRRGRLVEDEKMNLRIIPPSLARSHEHSTLKAFLIGFFVQK